MRACMCVRVHFIALPKALKSLPSGLSSSWRFDLNLSIWVANRPFLWYDFVCATVSMRLCVSVCLWIYLISDKRIRTAKPRRGSVLLIGALVWEHLWWFQTLMPFVVQRCLSSSAVFLPVHLLQASEKRGPGITSECLFHFVGRNEIGTEMWLSVLLDMVKDSVGRKSLRGETWFLSVTVWTGVLFVGEQWNWFSETLHCWS